MKIGNNLVGESHPAYFIADIASNHGGDIELAKELIHAAATAGAHAVKFQNFTAESLISNFGFENLKTEAEHQKKWKKSVYDSYDDASIPLSWTKELCEFAKKQGVDYFTSPYSIDLLEATKPFLDAIKIGSGDLTYHALVAEAAKIDLPLLVATGASDMQEVAALINVIRRYKKEYVLMQCNTNYTASSRDTGDDIKNRFNCINLRVLDTYKKEFPEAILGLSDHTHGSLTVLGAIGIFGARAIEKHFTLDNSQEGQDHSFSMNHIEWKTMMEQTNEVQNQINNSLGFEQRVDIVKDISGEDYMLDIALGSNIKKVEANEEATVQVQRRSICASKELDKEHIISDKDLVCLRPAPIGSLLPYEVEKLIGKRLNKSIAKGQNIILNDLK